MEGSRGRAIDKAAKALKMSFGVTYCTVNRVPNPPFSRDPT